MKRQVVLSNWRDDLSEYVNLNNVTPKKAKTDTRAKEKVEEKDVKNKVVINPTMSEAFEELGGIIISVTEELSKEEMEEMENNKDTKEGRRPGKVEESSIQMKIHQLMKRVQALRLAGERQNIGDEKKQEKREKEEKEQQKEKQKEKQKSQKGKEDQEQDVQMQDQVQERTMTPGEKKKETKLKKKYDDSDMKDNMKKQYGDEEGKKVYFATIRKQAMEGALNPFSGKDGKPDRGTPEQAKRIAKNISDNRKRGPMKYDPENDTKGT